MFHLVLWKVASCKHLIEKKKHPNMTAADFCFSILFVWKLLLSFMNEYYLFHFEQCKNQHKNLKFRKQRLIFHVKETCVNVLKCLKSNGFSFRFFFFLFLFLHLLL